MKYLVRLISQVEKSKIELELGKLCDKAKCLSEKLDINILFYLVYQQVSNHFIESIPKHFQEKARDSETIFCNYLDSHLWYEDDAIQKLREKSPYYM